MRAPKDGPEVAERTVVFLVDAHAVAVADQEAIDTLANATSAAHAEIEAKKVRQSWSSFSRPLVIMEAWAPLCSFCLPAIFGT